VTEQSQHSAVTHVENKTDTYRNISQNLMTNETRVSL